MPTTIKPPKGWSKTDVAVNEWRAGLVFYWSENAFDKPCWVEHRTRVSIRPGETGSQAYQRECGRSLPHNTFVFWRDV